MKGVGRATGAVTFVNALATGIGSAAGIALPAEVIVDLTPVRAEPSITVDPSGDSQLVRATTQAALRLWAPGRTFRSHVSVSSEIPPARGLKSSSAVSGAVGRAVASALGVYVTSDEVARLSADVSQQIGLSATGAFDDALAALEPGVHVTDNPARRRLRTDSLDPTWQVVLWIPRQPHLPSPTYRDAFQRLRAEGEAAETAARRGDPLAAMEANTRVVEAAVGYDYGAIRTELARGGALGSGVSGLGPTLASVVTADRVSAVLRGLPPGEGEVLVTRFAARPLSPLSEVL